MHRADGTACWRCRIELSLRSSAPKAMIGLEDLQEGQTVSGRVKRVEGYGVFITLAGSGLTGLCHISKVADEKVANLPSLFQPGQGGHSTQQCHAVPLRRKGHHSLCRSHLICASVGRHKVPIVPSHA